MSQEQTVLSQILQFVSYDDFRICVRRYDGNKGIRRFSCWEQFLAMAFGQLTYRESLRDIEVCLAAHRKHLYRSGFRYYSEEIDKCLVFLTNDFFLPALTVAAIYRQRWQVELFFKWIKQHLRIKRFLGTSPNSVKTQVWIAVAVYVLIAIVKKELALPHSLYTILQILSTTLFEKTPVPLVFQRYDDENRIRDVSKQLMLFDI